MDILVDLSPLAPDSRPNLVVEMFERVRFALTGGCETIVAAAPLDGSNGVREDDVPWPRGGGVAGLLKTAAKEWPDRRIRVVAVDPSTDPGGLAEHLAAELSTDDGPAEVVYENGARRVFTTIASSATGRGELELEEEAVVFLTGGARGITSGIARELAARFRCRLVLAGRSPLPEAEEDTETAAAPDAVGLRSVLAARGEGSPREIESRCRSILAAREIRATLRQVAAAGGSAEYCQVDVRDEHAFGALIDDLYARYGRLDGVVHAAGVIEDGLLRDKSQESFARVFETKVAGALTLARRLRDDVRFVVFFSSVAAAFGNRGQADYAAANDFLDKLAPLLNRRLPGRVVSIAWGPWSGRGMVTPELQREYERRGISLIDPEAGIESFLEELLAGGPDDAQVILASGDPGVLL
jgi:NAD(P)-dependent dehydrogenase (short-subunit alcohol dehydrogenase family)